MPDGCADLLKYAHPPGFFNGNYKKHSKDI